MKFSLLLTVCVNILSFSHAAPNSSSNFPTLTRRDAAAPVSTACGDVVRNATVNTFKAKLVYECLTSVPFDAAVATKFLKYYKDSIQFQSTLEYLKNPPPEYQQPAFDLLEGLDTIQGLINTAQFDNQYEFEAALQSVVFAAHDDHLSLTSGILGVFSFGTSYRIVTLSSDGIELPKVYLQADIILSLTDPSFKPSPIAKLDGIDATKYLTRFAALNGVGGIESHTDWNQLMVNPAQVIQGAPSLWGGAATFYPGETLKIELANGTKIETPWYGVFLGDSETGPLETGGDFYNSFVLGYWPAGFTPSEDEEEEIIERRAASSTSKEAATPTSTRITETRPPAQYKWRNIAYPKPDIAQDELGVPGGGVLSGYFLKGSLVAVLSVPTFQEADDSIDSFSTFVGDFIKSSKEKGIKKIVIDLQRNFGGDALLATDMYKQFFPGKDKDPFGGSRLRNHGAAEVMGETLTDYWMSTAEGDQDYYYLYANEWVAATRLNANTGENFTSWEEFHGPNIFNGGSFTTVQQYNLSDALFDTIATGSEEAFLVYGYGNRPVTTKQEYAAEDIILLTDGLCSSTCALFVEMMHHEAGVRTVVAGGRPFYGPMQAVGLSRGAAQYSVTTQLDSDIADTEAILEFYNRTNDFLPGRADALDVEVHHAGINLRDQIRKGDDTPLQFKYEAATCRIFYTPKSVYNFTRLWQDAADAMWTRPELCVKDSTGYSSTKATTTKLPPSNILPESSKIEAPPLKLDAIITSFFDSDSSIQAVKKPTKVKDEKKTKKPVSHVGKDCRSKDTLGKVLVDKYGDVVTNSKLCPANYFCDPNYTFCSTKTPGTKIKRAGCVKMCQNSNDPACGDEACYTIPEDDPAAQLDSTSRGYCNAPAKRKTFTCQKAANKGVQPGQPPAVGTKRDVLF